MKKLSNTSYTSALLFSKPKIEKIVFEVPESKQVKTDIGFVFGGISQEYRLQKALELYQNGLINKILLSGGIGKISTEKTKTDVCMMLEYLKQINTPKDIMRDILVEDKSRDTYENIVNSLKLYSKPNRTYTLISSDFHLRRCSGIFAYILDKSNQDGMFSISPVMDNQTDKNNWQNNKMGNILIYKELLSLLYHAKNKKMYDEELYETPEEVKKHILK